MSRPTELGATRVTPPADLAWFDFPIPGHTGALRAAFLNRDISHGPIVALLEMGSGARIPAHFHERTTEMFWVVSGTFRNAGIDYVHGTVFTVAPGDIHGPHETVDGCVLAFAQAVEVDPTDFFLAE